jgi:NAD-dependent deacetylase
MIKSARHCVAFTGAGISVESGIPPFRGENGLWNRYDPATFEIGYFLSHSTQSWAVMQDVFYNLFSGIKPNSAHYALAELEQKGIVKAIITQNVDNLHTEAGSRVVHEFHGSLKRLVCLNCHDSVTVDQKDLAVLPPRCDHCRGVMKPDAVFFGESIPEPAHSRSFKESERSDCFVLIGTTGEVAPANLIPRLAKQQGATIIEINTASSSYTRSITDVFLKERATVAMEQLMEEIAKL